VVALWDLLSGLRKAFFQTFEADGGYASDARLVDSVLIVVFCETDPRDTWRVSTWGAVRGDHLQTTRLPCGIRIVHEDLRISGDGTKVFGLDAEHIRVWSASTGESLGSIPFELPHQLRSPSFIVDGSRVWICPENSSTQGWDLEHIREPSLSPTNTPPDRRRLNFIKVGGTRQQDAGRTRIEDTTTGKEVYRLPKRFAQPSVAQWDGRYLVAAYNEADGAGAQLLILEFPLVTS